MNVLTGETCLLTLDYAYYHLACCLLQAAVLLACGRTKHFRIAHAFGLFALVMDYGLMYMTKGTRQLSYPNEAANMDSGENGGDEPMGALGTLLFFVWFDYSAFGVVLWALELEQQIRNCILKGVGVTVRGIVNNPVVVFSLWILPAQFWTAPALAHTLQLDSRTILLSRPSSKLTYVIMIVLFTFLLLFSAQMDVKKGVLPILISGFGCGLVHHAALFTFGMRGYSDAWSLVVTLLTEWPALIAGVAVVRRCARSWTSSAEPFFKPTVDSAVVYDPPSGRGTKLFTSAMWLLLVAVMYPHLAAIDDKDAMAYLIPLIPGEKMQTVGTAFMRARTCVVPRLLPAPALRVLNGPPVDCWARSDEAPFASHNDGNDMLVMASAAKSGAVLSARIVVELGVVCGVCVASGERSEPGIPGPVEDLPVYEGKLLHAIINMRSWPMYVKRYGYDMRTLLDQQTSESGAGRVRCVTLVREPLSRLRSLYTYARSGGEHWFRYKSGLMQRLSNQSLSLQQSVELFWDTFGKGYLVQSHEYMMMNIDLGCKPIKMESFSQNYTATTLNILQEYGVHSRAVPHLLSRLSGSDVSKKTLDQQRQDAHVTANKFSNEFVKNVKVHLLKNRDVREMVEAQRVELGYTDF